MSYLDIQFAELHALVADLGKDGGLISPSIYDTAQVIRLYPPSEGMEPAMQWLLQQQCWDGGWGEPSAPYVRDVPTLATILALHTSPQSHQTASAIEAALTFLQQEADKWADLAIDNLPVATEMILPRLLQEAQQAGLAIDPRPYASLFKLHHRKCQQIQQMKPNAGSAPTYSWEAWGQTVTPPLFDSSGGIGHSPSATAAWLRQAKPIAGYNDLREQGQRYLQKASAATFPTTEIPGVVPNVWPITGFERAYGPYILLATGLFHHPFFHDVINAQVRELATIIQRGNGVSFGDYFAPDVDETALTTASLHATNTPYSLQPLLQFRNGDHFYTFHHELNPSVFSNAHALYALSQLGQHDDASATFLRRRQAADGRWLADKWHSSWIYTTLEVVLALGRLGQIDPLHKTVNVLLAHQEADGSWGAYAQASQVETSYAVLALYHLHCLGLLDEIGISALQRGQAWLARQYQPYTYSDERHWLGKELYTPYRVDRIYILCANLTTTLMPEELWSWQKTLV